MPQKPVPTRATTQDGGADSPSSTPRTALPTTLTVSVPSGGGTAAAGDGDPVGEQPQGRADQGPDRHEQRRHVSPSPARSSASTVSPPPTTARPASRPATTAATPPRTEAST